VLILDKGIKLEACIWGLVANISVSLVVREGWVKVPLLSIHVSLCLTFESYSYKRIKTSLL
jgi:hypothetical protein